MSDSPKQIRCDTHGWQDSTFACQHIVQGLFEGQRYGFWWAQDSGQARPDAWCTSCNELVASNGGEWTEEILEIVSIKLLCGACYDRAKAMNLKTEG